jgi:hypothetical protein
VVEDGLDREVGHHCPGELAQHRRESAIDVHAASPKSEQPTSRGVRAVAAGGATLSGSHMQQCVRRVTVGRP